MKKKDENMNKKIVIQNLNGQHLDSRKMEKYQQKYGDDTVIVYTEGKTEAEYLKKIFTNNLNYYMNKKGVNASDISKTLDLKYSTVRDWCNAKNYPRVDKMQLLADYFNIEKSDLTEKKINTKIRIFNRIPAHKPINDINGDSGVEELPKYWFEGGKKYFGFIITDNSMYDDYRKRRYCYF